MSVVNIPTAATGYRQSIIRDAQGAQRAVNKMQMSPTLNANGIVQPLGRITNSASEFQKSMDASAARVFAFGAAVGVINGVSDAFRAMIQTTAEVEKSLKDVQVVMEASNQAMQKFGDGLFDVARNTATSFKDVAESATELARQGLSAEETLARVNSALILSRLSGLDAVKSTETLTAAINSFNKEGITHSQIINRMANVDAAFAVSSADLAEAMSRAGAVAQSSGVSFNELAAVVTAVQQRTARGGSVIGNGFKSIFTRIKRSGVREALEEIGVTTKNNDGSFRDSMSVILDYAGVYKTLSDSQKAYTAEQLAGVYQIQNLQALIQDLNSGYSIYNKALGVANNTTNEAIQRNKDLNTTLDAMFTQTQLSAKELASSIGNLAFSGNFKEILTFLNSLAQKLNDLLSENEGSNVAKNLIRGIGSFLTGPGMVILGAAFLKIFGLVTKFAKEAFSDILGLNRESKRQQGLQAAIGQILSTNSGIYQKILAAGSSTAKQEQIILNLIKQETAERLKQEALIKRIAASSRLIGVGTSEKGFVPVGKGASKTKGRNTLRMSNGFLPSLNKEKQDINSGVGGARKTDKPVLIKNHKMGRGRSENVVAHTGEWAVNNFGGGGGTAIFNRDMAKQYGLPKGAKKITAANGFIPNFNKLLNKKHSYSSLELGASAAGKGPISRLSDLTDRFIGRVKVQKMDLNNDFFGKNAAKIIRGSEGVPGLIEKSPEAEKKGLTKYQTNQKAVKVFRKRYGSQIKSGPYKGILETAKNIQNSKFNNYSKTEKQPKQLGDLFQGLSSKIKGLEGEYQSKVFLQKRGYSDVQYIPDGASFDLSARKKGVKKDRLFETKATKKQNVVVALKKAADQYLNMVAAKQKGLGEKPIGHKNNKRENINLTSGNALFGGGINMITPSDTKLSQSVISANKESFKQTDSFRVLRSMIDPDFKNKQAIYKYSSQDKLSNIFSTRIKSIDNQKELEFYKKYVTNNLNKNAPIPKSIEDLIKRKDSSQSQSLFLDPNHRIPSGGVRSASSGFIPNFIDKRNRYQKIQDTLKDPANKNIKFKSSLFKRESVSTVKKGMGGEFQKLWLESYFKKGLEGDFQMLMKMGYNPDKLLSLRKHFKKGGKIDIKTMGKGFIPNYANSSEVNSNLIPNFARNALSEALQRETEAGVPRSKIRIERSPDLITKENPIGLAVTNTRDEPMGISQGIKRAKAEGVDPRTYGSARAKTPNFAAGVQTKKGFFTTQKINRLKDGDFSKDPQGEKVYLNMFSVEDQKKIKGFEAQNSKQNVAAKKQASRDIKNKMPTIDASTQATMLVATNNVRRRVDTSYKTEKGNVRMKYRVEGIKPKSLKNTEGNIRSRIEDLMLGESSRLAREMAGAGNFGMNLPGISRMANAGSVGSASGSIFETALQAVGKNRLFTKNNASFDINGTPDDKLQKLFGYYTPFADAKIALNADTKRDFSSKVLKIPQNTVKLSKAQKEKQMEVSRASRKSYGPLTKAATGYIPNFAGLRKNQKQDLVTAGFAKNHKEASKKYNHMDHHYLIDKKLSKKEWLRQKSFDVEYGKMTGVRYLGKQKGYGAFPGNQEASIGSQTKRSSRIAKTSAVGAAVSMNAVSQIQNTVQGLVSRVGNIEKQIGVQNLSSGYIPNFALRDRDKSIRKLDPNTGSVGFIESIVKESMLSGDKNFTKEAKEVAGNRSLVIDRKNQEIKIDGKEISPKDLRRIILDPKNKKLIQGEVNSRLVKFQQKSGLAEHLNFFLGSGATPLEKRQKDMRSAVDIDKRHFFKDRGYWGMSSEGISSLIQKNGGRSLDLDNFLNQTVIHSQASTEKRRQLQEKNKKKKGRGINTSMLSPGYVSEKAQQLGLAVKDKAVAMGGKFMNTVGSIPSDLSNIINLRNMNLMSPVERARKKAFERFKDKKMSSPMSGFIESLNEKYEKSKSVSRNVLASGYKKIRKTRDKYQDSKRWMNDFFNSFGRNSFNPESGSWSSGVIGDQKTKKSIIEKTKSIKNKTERSKIFKGISSAWGKGVNSLKDLLNVLENYEEVSKKGTIKSSGIFNKSFDKLTNANYEQLGSRVKSGKPFLGEKLISPLTYYAKAGISKTKEFGQKQFLNLQNKLIGLQKFGKEKFGESKAVFGKNKKRLGIAGALGAGAGAIGLGIKGLSGLSSAGKVALGVGGVGVGGVSAGKSVIGDLLTTGGVGTGIGLAGYAMYKYRDKLKNNKLTKSIRESISGVPTKMGSDTFYLKKKDAESYKRKNEDIKYDFRSTQSKAMDLLSGRSGGDVNELRNIEKQIEKIKIRKEALDEFYQKYSKKTQRGKPGKKRPTSLTRRLGGDGLPEYRFGSRSNRFSEGRIPNFARPARRFKQFNKNKYLKELKIGKNKNEQYKIDAYVKAAGGAQKFQRIHEKFGLDKIDDVFQILGFSKGHIPNFSKLANLILSHNKKIQASKPLGGQEFSNLSGRVADFNRRIQGSKQGELKTRPVTSIDRKQPFKISKRNRIQDLDNIKRFTNSSEFKNLPKELQEKLILFYNNKKANVSSLKNMDPEYLRHSANPSFKGKISNYGNGFLPNFALDQAIARESEALKQRGISSSKIKVEKSSLLKGPMNPQGLAVINTVDEPMGIQQGINRANKTGLNPKTHGIPSFAISPEEKKLIKEKELFKLEQERKQSKLLGRDKILNPYAGMDSDKGFELKQQQDRHNERSQGSRGFNKIRKHGLSPVARQRMSNANAMAGGASMGAMFMGPMAAEMIRDGRQDEAVGGSGRLGMDVLNSAAMGAAFGPTGMALGAFQGVSSGLNQMSNRDSQADTFKALSKAKKDLDKVMKDTSSIQNLAMGVQQLQAASQSGDTKGIIAANTQIRESINKISDPEVQSRMNQLANSGMSASQKLALLGEAIKNMGAQAAAKTALLQAGTAANEDDKMGPGTVAKSWFGDLVQTAVAGAKTGLDFLTGEGNTYDYNKETLSGRDPMQGKLGEATDMARNLNDSFETQARMLAQQQVASRISEGTSFVSGSEDLRGKTQEEIALARQTDLKLDAGMQQEEARAFNDLFKEAMSNFAKTGKLSTSKVGKSLEEMPGGAQSFENFDRLATSEDGTMLTFGGAVLKEFAQSALDGKEALESMGDGIQKAVEIQSKIVNLEEKLLSEYQNMLQAQQNVDTMMSRFQSNQSLKDYQGETKTMARSSANEYLSSRNYIDPRGFQGRQASIENDDIKRRNESGLITELMNEVASNIDMSALFNPSEIEKREMNIPEPKPTSGTGKFEQDIQRQQSEQNQMLARQFAEFAAGNKDGNVTLKEMKGFLGSIKGTGQKGNRIAQNARDLEVASSQKMIAELQRVAINQLIASGDASSSRLENQGGRRLNDEDVKTGVEAAMNTDSSVIPTMGLPTDATAEPVADTIDAFRTLADVLGVSSTIFTGLNSDTENYIVALANVNDIMDQLQNMDPTKAAELRPVFEKIKANLEADLKNSERVAEELKKVAGKEGLDPNLIKDPIKGLTVQLGNLWKQGLVVTNLSTISTPLQDLVNRLTGQEGEPPVETPPNGGNSDGEKPPTASPPEGSQDFSAAIKVIQELPAKLSEQLGGLVINHEVKGGITFDFNSEVVKGVLTPVMRDQLRSILQEGVILDYLATALAPKIDPQGVLK